MLENKERIRPAADAARQLHEPEPVLGSEPGTFDMAAEYDRLLSEMTIFWHQHRFAASKISLSGKAD